VVFEASGVDEAADGVVGEVAQVLASIFRRLVEWVWVASLPVSWG